MQGRTSKSAERRFIDPAQSARLLAAMPPHAHEAEVALLGSLLVDPRVTGDVLQLVREGDEFFRPAHRAIFAAISQIYERTASVDIVQVTQLLKDRGQLEDVGGVDYLVSLAEGVPSASHALEFARTVRDKATLRELIDAAGQILAEAHSSSEEVPAVLEAAEARIFSIAQRRETGGAAEMRVLIDETLKMLESADGRQVTGVSTGFSDIDELTCGFQRGEMIVVAARPSMGKTALALNLMERISAQGVPVAIFSLEMSRQALVQRLLCARAGVDGQKLRRGMLRESDMERLIQAADSLRQCRIFIDDTASLTSLALRSRARRLRDKHGIGAVFIDYLQLMTSGKRAENRQIEVSEMSRSIKALAREIDAPVICLSQLNRGTEDRTGHRPRLSDLRESGSIEQDADVVMLLHREDYYHIGDEEWKDSNPDKVGLAELIVAKQRNGPTATVRLVWDSASTAFKDFSRAESGIGSGYVSASPSAVGRAYSSGERDGDDREDDLPV